MKKGYLLFLIVFLMFASIVYADSSVTLQSPSVDGSTVTLTCIGATTEGNLRKVEFLTDTTGSFAVNYTNDTLERQIETVTTTITNIPNGNYNWNCRFFNNTNDDSVNFTAVANGQFTISVSENTAPQFSGTIPSVSFPEDTTKSNAFDLDDYFTDDETLEYSQSGNTQISVSISNGQVTFSAAANWSGAETITFTASDGSLTNTSNGVLVNVTPIDDPPYLSSAIPNQSWIENTNKSISLSSYFSDIDTSTLGYTASNPDHITVYINGSQATLVSESDWRGNATITFYANDTYNVTASNVVNLNVRLNGTGNSPPEIDFYKPLLSSISMKDTDARDFEINASDPDGDNITIKWQLDGTDIEGATSESYNLKTPTAGDRVLKVIVSDGELTTTHTWNIKVKEGIDLDEETTPTTVASDVGSILEETAETTPVCGDGAVDEGENCGNCPEDVECGPDEVCIDNLCTKKPSKMKVIIIIAIVAIVIGGIVFLLYRLNTSKQNLNLHRGGIMEGTPKRVDLKKIGVRPVSDVEDFYSKKSKRSKMTSPRNLKKDIKAPKFDESILEGYIKRMRDIGHTDQEIESKLKEKGWPDWQVEIILKKFK